MKNSLDDSINKISALKSRKSQGGVEGLMNSASSAMVSQSQMRMMSPAPARGVATESRLFRGRGWVNRYFFIV